MIIPCNHFLPLSNLQRVFPYQIVDEHLKSLNDEYEFLQRHFGRLEEILNKARCLEIDPQSSRISLDRLRRKGEKVASLMKMKLRDARDSFFQDYNQISRECKELKSDSKRFSKEIRKLERQKLISFFKIKIINDYFESSEDVMFSEFILNIKKIHQSGTVFQRKKRKVTVQNKKVKKLNPHLQAARQLLKIKNISFQAFSLLEKLRQKDEKLDKLKKSLIKDKEKLELCIVDKEHKIIFLCKLLEKINAVIEAAKLLENNYKPLRDCLA